MQQEAEAKLSHNAAAILHSGMKQSCSSRGYAFE
jgi:hypothetical protein